MSGTPPDPTPAQRWFRLAEEDLHAGRVLVAEGSAALRIADFLAQQAAEKALKAALLASSVNAPKIHGLRQLHGLLPADPQPPISDEDMDELDPWVIDGRYAADLPDLSQSEAHRLLDAATRIINSVRPAAERHADSGPTLTDTTRSDADDG